MVKFVIIYGLEVNEDADGLKFNGRCLNQLHITIKLSKWAKLELKMIPAIIETMLKKTLDKLDM